VPGFTVILIIQNATDMILLKTFIALSFILVAEHATFIALCRLRKLKIYIFLVVIHLFFPLAFAECDDSLPFSGFSSIPLYYTLFPATLLHQLFFHPLTPHLAIYFLVYLSVLLFQNSYIILFWEFYFLPLCTYPNQ